mmetsp:Transcript_26173/g.44636  ORF Transcript_26173/g.44636 Transcript_26173/m.44636 type:complete len:410 (+) Transcript_26173:155-1384(+)
MSAATGNVRAAFGLVCIAGAASAVGASVVFFPALVKRASRRVLASSLGLSAGVIVYVAFLEIFGKSAAAFVDGGTDENLAFIYATLSFFGGVLVMLVVDFGVKRLTRRKLQIHRDHDEDIEITWSPNEEVGETNEYQEISLPHCCLGCTKDPVKELETWHEMAEMEVQGGQFVPSEIAVGRRESETVYDEESGGTANNISGSQKSNDDNPIEGIDDNPSERKEAVVILVENVSTPQQDDGLLRAPAVINVNPKEERRKLVKVGLSTALAILLHNFPEGLATFVAALDDQKVGLVFTIAISLHNLPEGICVALPIYYATGNRWKAFGLGCIAGLSEPLAALLGWLVLASALSQEACGIIFGLGSGIMVFISMKELIPTAHRYDPEDTVVTNSILVGMSVMALSLVLVNIR